MSSNHRDDEGSRLGMWLFLFTEIMLFGGLFVLYSVYLGRYPDEFHHASKELDTLLGTVNTVVLITSSLFVALSVVALKRNQMALARQLVLATVGFALVFLVVKAFEWGAKFEHGLYPGGQAMALREQGEMVFFALYFMMTGLHGVHVLVGMAVLLWAWARMGAGQVNPQNPLLLENGGLYWHLVDLIWIYLFPLFYLIT